MTPTNIQKSSRTDMKFWILMSISTDKCKDKKFGIFRLASRGLEGFVSIYPWMRTGDAESSMHGL